MEKVLKILHLEDSQLDAELIQSILETEGLKAEIRRVETRPEFTAALDEGGWDLILADFALPTYDGKSALLLAREKRPEIPFILVSGAIGEEFAIEILKAGATDYVLKTALSGLAPAVRRALHEDEELAKRKQAEDALKDSEERFRAIAETATDAIVVQDSSDNINYWNRKAEEMFGYAAAEALGKKLHELIVPERFRERAHQGMRKFYETGEGPLLGKIVEFYAVRKDGSEFPIELSISAMQIRGERQAAGIIRDITQRKQAEATLKEEMELTSLLLALSESLSKAADIDQLMEAVAISACRITECETCRCYLWDKEDREFQLSHEKGGKKEWEGRAEKLDASVSFIKKALEEKKSFLIENTESFKELLDLFPSVHSAIVIPFVKKEENLGFLLELFTAAHQFTEREQKILDGIGNEGSLAIERAKLYRESQDRAMELAQKIETIKVMHEIDRSILSTMERQEILDTVVRMVAKVIPCEGAKVFILDKEKNGFVYQAGFGFIALAKGDFLPFGDTLCSEAITTVKPKYVSNFSEISNLPALEKKLAEEGFLSCITVPVIVKEEPIGIISAGSKRASAFSSENLSTLVQMAAQVAVALEHVRLLADLEEYSKTLEKKVAERTAELEVKNRELEELSKMRAEFISTASHDLRAPLTGVLGFAELLLRGKAEPLADKQRQYIQTIYQSGRDLLTIIEDFLEISRIDAGRLKINKEATNVVDWINRSMTSLEPLFNGKKITLAVEIREGLPLIYADPNRFNQMLTNYLSNALKFTPEGGKVTVRAEQDGDFIKISVIDNGIGISPEDQQKLFQRFFQAEATKYGIKGTGLGLSIVKQLAEAQGGTVGMYSELEKGSTFWFTLPMFKKAEG